MPSKHYVKCNRLGFPYGWKWEQPEEEEECIDAHERLLRPVILCCLCSATEIRFLRFGTRRRAILALPSPTTIAGVCSKPRSSVHLSEMVTANCSCLRHRAPPGWWAAQRGGAWRPSGGGGGARAAPTAARLGASPGLRLGEGFQGVRALRCTLISFINSPPRRQGLVYWERRWFPQRWDLPPALPIPMPERTGAARELRLGRDAAEFKC